MQKIPDFYIDFQFWTKNHSQDGNGLPLAVAGTVESGGWIWKLDGWFLGIFIGSLTCT